MKPLILFFLFPFLLTAQDKSIIFTMRDHQVKELILSREDNIRYEYRDGLITTYTVIAGVSSQTFNYYSGDDRLDSVIIHTHLNNKVRISKKIYDYNGGDQLVSMRKGRDLLRENVEVDSFFYNSKGQLIQMRQYQNKLGVEAGYRRVDHLLPQVSVDYEYNKQAQIMRTTSSGWMLPSTTYYYYDEQGRDMKSEKILFVDATKAEENEACLRIVSENKYNDTGLLELTSVSTYEIKSNGREKKIPGKMRMSRRYTFYDNL
ncbi:hypothetical protein [Lewinella cohaerens]|uniref:hypothetical protein n=1 Tax=Lewinella cohaerens TaxID=70995 RepID=UPI000375CC67|nr:hypothetical protein [Lewinella cohaerens]